MAQQQQSQNNATRKEGETYVSKNDTDKKVVTKDLGEYTDFEQIPEEK